MDRNNISIRFYANSGALLQVALSLSNQFLIAIEGASKPLQHQIELWFDSYLERKPIGFFPIPKGTPFQEAVWGELTKIPFGQTISYGELAARIGKFHSARAVGSACGKNPFPLLIPCHRVIQADGSIGGFALDLEIKRRLLHFER